MKHKQLSLQIPSKTSRMLMDNRCPTFSRPINFLGRQWIPVPTDGYHEVCCLWQLLLLFDAWCSLQIFLAQVAISSPNSGPHPTVSKLLWSNHSFHPASQVGLRLLTRPAVGRIDFHGNLSGKIWLRLQLGTENRQEIPLDPLAEGLPCAEHGHPERSDSWAPTRLSPFGWWWTCRKGHLQPQKF